MSRYVKMNPDDFKHMVWDAGIALDNFDPETGEYSPEDIKFATTGDNSFSAKRDLSDLGEPINNCPEGTMQLMRAKPWQAQISGTAVTITPALAAELLGNADVVSGKVSKIVPRNDLKASDFRNKWIVANYSEFNGEKKGGGFALHLKNAFSIDGLSTALKKNANGEFPFTFKAFYDLENMDDVPFEIYIWDGEDDGDKE